MLDRDQPALRALLYHPRPSQKKLQEAEYECEELENLAVALEVAVISAEIVPLRDVKVSNYFGKGKIQEIKAAVKGNDADLVIVNGALSPIQQRNLERIWQAKVIDRTGLILEIFALRAATKEGRLQVELARQAYERSRLVRTWTHLERQRGGQGFLAGPGETQIEADRRMLADKIRKLKRDIEQVRSTRGLQRTKRRRAPERVVALVGYTNAGKSSLFNHLTAGGVMAKDMLFATLDTTHRIMPLPSGKPAVLSDTVGFISDLPTDLISAFRATLEEVKEADLILHVRDIADPLSEQRKDDVMDVLNRIEAGPDNGQSLLEVWNKIDLLSVDQVDVLSERMDAQNMLNGDAPVAMISCLSGVGMEPLLQQIEAVLSASDVTHDFVVPPSNYGQRAWLYEHGQILEEFMSDSGEYKITAQLSDVDWGRYRAKYKANNI